VQFRGSTGFGTRFLNAGDHEFGPGKVHTDLIDALDWAIAKGIADPKRAGIMGWSFGGYATLSGLAFAPERFACGVDGVGPGNLGMLIESFPPYWATRRQRWINRMGDVVGDTLLNRRLSPFYHADAIRAPLLVGQGANDPRVKLATAEATVRQLRAAGRDVQFVVYPDEGHGFGRLENNRDFYGRVEEFLAKHLGGRAEPWRAVPGSSAEVR
jgi:dipeptidyl aminopeptidase/acylaminoacyl peptidase